MHRITPAIAAFAIVLCIAPAMSAHACGEGQFNMGQGMRYQGYLTPRPATVLVYDADPSQRKNIYQGLYRAGHRLTVARNADDLSQALHSKHFDVVISDLDDSGALGGAGAARLLPVVQRQQRNDVSIRNRFRVFLLDGASLGQYLKGIDQLVRVPLK